MTHLQGRRPQLLRPRHRRGALPDLSTYDDVLAAGEAIVAGEAARQTAEGAAFVPMALPTAAEVQTALTAFTAARSDAQRAQVKTDSEREDVSALYPEAQFLAVGAEEDGLSRGWGGSY
jgi:hypothetical protein